MPGLFYPPFSLLWQTFRPSSVFSEKRKVADNQYIINHLPRAENGTRTRDLNLGKVALYQLSYFRKIYLPRPGKLRFLRFGTANIK